ncbi:17-beta-hydroxysteroid dehydrogenase 13-like isoform X1 [Dinothrombium tinctorium]|uniref:Short-chain dehydrogenase/reductase 3 n=1 Tax=Dinothrombium tinctorium TaxID=1965070 RepID=A0A443R9B7_9ACAR|nr:17-beta-hydroxysteroid dehydrogenase 13-like isoform X1 [Dinothrombium tinctorium]RWS11856.1 17-beta-hydroxysteroid dehydrogenase 13-like isoform X1 [Dinothrombium tinctorium]RWS12129.1 17-beta-hydroxysteroid dehydrogenase 13-like isoform X1 [Dinothrombium tinctorium]RWS12353.1 17-beta-hydroxysteroid dehydrogenase 13-like isoform X1 [Dinothrombium tinctorium]
MRYKTTLDLRFPNFFRFALLFAFNSLLFFIELFQLYTRVVFALIESLIYATIISKRRKSIANELILITGAAHGIGRHLALSLAQYGPILVLWDIDKEQCDRTASEVVKQGGIAYSYKVDVSDFDQVEQTSLKVRQTIGDVYMVINNAGILNCKALWNLTSRGIEKTIKTNLLSHFWTVKCFLPRMQQVGRGHIVAMSSNMGLYGRSYFTDYAASKFGVIGFMQALDDELRVTHNNNIVLTTICPSAVETGLSKIRPTRISWLLPVLNLDYTVNRIIDAILRDEHLVIFPYGYKIFYYIIRQCPRKVSQLITDFVGNTVEPN